MDIKYRICLCLLLALTAAFCASYTIADVRGELPAHAAARTAEEPEPEAGYRLCAREGCVAVLDPALGETAVVTDIELDTLRDADRALVEAGLQVETREALLSLLEDLGS